MDYNDYITRAAEQAMQCPIGETFKLRDLFTGTDWNAIGRGDKLTLGKLFKQEVVEGNIPHLEFVGKAENNSSLYKRIA